MNEPDTDRSIRKPQRPAYRRRAGVILKGHRRITSPEVSVPDGAMSHTDEVRPRGIEKLREQISDTRFRTLVDQSPLSIQILAPDGRTLSVNRAWEKLFGVTLEQIADYNLLQDEQLVAKGVMPYIRRAFAGESVTIPPIPYVPDRGKYMNQERWTRAVIYPMKDDSGQVHEVVLIHEDITEHKQAEEALEFQKVLLESLSQASIDGILVVSGSGQIIFYNRRFAEMWDMPQEVIETQSDEVALRSVYDKLVRPDEFMARVRYLYRHPVEESREEIGLKDGRIFDRYSAPVKSADGMLYGRVWFFRDITERKRADDRQRFLAYAGAILASSLDFETTLQSIANLVVPALADWCIVDLLEEDDSLRQVAVKHVERAQESLVRELREAYPPDPNLPHGYSKVLRTGEPEIYPELTPLLLQTVARDARHLEIMQRLQLRSYMCIPLLTRGRVIGAITFGLAHPGRRYTPEDLAQAQELAGRAALAIDNARLYHHAQEAIRTRDQFLSIASHELKTPLTSLLGYAQLLQRHAESSGLLHERDQRAIGVISDQAQRLSRLVNTLLDLSRIQIGQLSIERHPVDMSALARRLVEEAQPGLSKHTLRLIGADASLRVEGDEMRLVQVLQNLIYNAIKYSPGGGEVLIKLEVADISQSRDAGRALSISVSDQGIGIPAQSLSQIFNRFYRASNVDGHSISGMGMGLYVVREIVTRHGGTVEASSQEGQGSTFTVRLPLATTTGTS